jgi:hypothetical protein
MQLDQSFVGSEIIPRATRSFVVVTSKFPVENAQVTV